MSAQAAQPYPLTFSVDYPDRGSTASPPGSD